MLLTQNIDKSISTKSAEFYIEFRLANLVGITKRETEVGKLVI